MAKTTIEFTERSSEKLSGLAKALSTTRADVLRSALSLYALLEKEIRGSDDRFLAIIDVRDEVRKIVAVPGLQRRDAILSKRQLQRSVAVATSAGAD